MTRFHLKWFVLLVNVVCVMGLAFNTTAVMNALPAIQHDLGLHPTTARWVINLYILCGATFILFAGSLGDLLGHFRMQFFGVALFALTSLGLALCGSGEQMLCLRALQGTAAAIVSAVALSSISSVFPLEQKSLAMTIWGGMVGLGFGLGPLLGGAIVTYLSWRYMFGLLFVLMTICAVGQAIFWWVYPKTQQKLTFDLGGLFLFIGWIAPLIVVIMEAGRLGWLSKTELSLAGISIIMLVLFLQRMQKAKNPFLNLNLLKQPALLGGTLIFFATIFSLIVFLYFYNRFLQWPFLYGASAWQAGLWMLPLNLAMFLAALLANRLIFYLGSLVVLALGMALLMLGFSCFFYFPNPFIGPFQMGVLVVLGCGFGFTFPVAPHVALKSLPASFQGQGSGILNTGNYLAGSLAISVGAVVYLQVAAYDLPGIPGGMRDQLLMSTCQETLPTHINLGLLQQAACHGFSSLMLLSCFVCLGGFISSCFLIKRKIDFVSKIE